MLIGFGLQSGVAVFFPLSDECITILSNSNDDSTTTTRNISPTSPSFTHDMTTTIALALRNGILSVLPEVMYRYDSHQLHHRMHVMYHIVYWDDMMCMLFSVDDAYTAL